MDIAGYTCCLNQMSLSRAIADDFSLSFQKCIQIFFLEDFVKLSTDKSHLVAHILFTQLNQKERHKEKDGKGLELSGKE